jgi:glyoxylase-like metal-dependent hydrolase (beta-lactamase superfamily II)
MKEVLPGIYQITLSLKGFGSGSVNTYLIRDKNRYAIIDTGWDAPEPENSLREQLAEASIDFCDIKKVILTHCHIDHLGLINKFKKSNNASIYIHRGELALIKVLYNGKNSYWDETDKYLTSHGIPESELGARDIFPVQEPPVSPDVLFEGNEEIEVGDYILKVVPTPGHTPGHIALYEPRAKFLFSGDTILPTILTNAAGHIQHMVNPLQQYLKSLEVLRQMDIDLVLPGHEQAFTSYKERIADIIERYRSKIALAWKNFENDLQTRTAYDVARVLPWIPRYRPIAWTHLRSMDKRFALMQTIAILEELAYEGKLARLIQDGRVFYKRLS